MRPVHEVLEVCKSYLYSPANGIGEYRICFALATATGEEVITSAEAEAAQDAIFNAIRKLAGGVEETMCFLQSVASLHDLYKPTRHKMDPTDPAYIEFRDKWLDDLIEEQRNAVPKPTTQQNQPGQ